MIDPAALEDRVRRFVGERVPSLLHERAAVLAASGGGDSTALTALLCEAGIIEPSRCVVGHFDHRLRDGAAALRDRDAVSALCDRYGLTLVEDAWDAPRRGEAAAREARYAFLSHVCRVARLDVVVTGHTADDQAETVLMHALRGAGLNGLAGMAAEAALPIDGRSRIAHSRPTLVRPLLCLSREETRRYCELRGLAFADDATNDDLTLLRNRIRRDLLPAMELARPGARDALLTVSARARQSIALLDAAAARAILEVRDGRVTLSRRVLRELPATVAVHAFRAALTAILGDARDFDRRHYGAMRAAKSARTGSTFQLPRGVHMVADSDTLVLSVGPLAVAALPEDFERALPFRGLAGDWWIEITPATAAIARSTSGGERSTELVPPSGAVLRAWRPGDRIQPWGMGGHKKLQDYYVDRKVPRRERRAAPILACGRDVLWTPLAPAVAQAGPVAAPRRGGAGWAVRWRRLEAR